MTFVQGERMYTKICAQGKIERCCIMESIQISIALFEHATDENVSLNE